MPQNSILVVRGGGDLASGVIHRLFRCGYRVLILESRKPSAIRREVSFCEAVYDGEAFVEGVLSHRIHHVDQCEEIWKLGEIRVNENERRNVIAISDVFRGRIVDVGQESLIVELTGNQSKLEGFLNLVQGYEILELARTGVTGLSRGAHDVRYLD